MNNQQNVFSHINPQKSLSDTRHFFQSQSFFARLAYLALVLVVFVILLKVITKTMVKVFAPSKSPYILRELKPADIPATISQNPSAANSIPIIRSTNRKDGIEFTYNLWMFIQSIPEISEKQYHQVFFKGNTNTPIIRGNSQHAISLSKLPKRVFKTLGHDLSGINFPDNGPGLYLTQLASKGEYAKTLGLAIIMNTFKNILETLVIPDISIRKWICVTIRVMGRNIDVYINGVIVKRHVLHDIPKQNYGDIFINNNKGFNGSVSSMKYFNKALNAKEIYNLVKKGPNLEMDDALYATPPYYSSDWYFSDDKIDYTYV